MGANDTFSFRCHENHAPRGTHGNLKLSGVYHASVKFPSCGKVIREALHVLEDGLRYTKLRCGGRDKEFLLAFLCWPPQHSVSWI